MFSCIAITWGTRRRTTLLQQGGASSSKLSFGKLRDNQAPEGAPLKWCFAHGARTSSVSCDRISSVAIYETPLQRSVLLGFVIT